MAAKDVEAGRAHVLLSIRDRMTQGLKLAEKRFQTFGRYAATTGAVMSGGALATLAWPVKLSADMEQATVAMEVFLGSASAARKMISDIELMAAKTPFRFDELKDAANLLLGFGASGGQVLPMLQLLGDASRGNSESFARLSLAFGQTMAKGRLMGQEVLQMTEQGFNPLYWISKQTGKSMESLMKEMEAGRISFSMLVGAFQYATGPMGKFNGMMDKQSQTLIGLTSSFLDFFSMLARSVGDTLVPMFKSVLTAANSIAIGFTAIVKANSGLVGGIAKAVLIVGLIGGALVSLGAAAMGVSFVLGLLASGLSAMMAMILAPITAIGLLWSAFMGIVSAVAGVATAIVGLFTALPALIAAVFSPMGLLVVGFIAAAAAALYYRDAVGETIRGVVALITPSVASLGEFAAGFQPVLDAAGSAVTGIVNALAAGDIQLAGAIALGALRAMFYQALAEIPGIGKLMATGFGQAILAGRWDLAARIGMLNIELAVMQGWNAIRNYWTGITTGLLAIWDTMVHAIRTGWHTASSGIAYAFTWVIGKIGMGITSLQVMFDGLVTMAKVAATAVKGFFTGNSKQASEEGRRMLDEYKTRTEKRIKGSIDDDAGMMKIAAEDAKRMQQQIDRDYEKSMIGRSENEQKTLESRRQGEQQLAAQISALNAQAGAAAADAGVTTAEDAAFKARYELADMTDKARQLAQQKGDAAGSRVVPGMAAASGGLPKMESRGTFSAAAASAFGNRSNATEQTARNTAMANKLLRVIADKRGPQFS